MTTAQIVETSVTVNNNIPIQDYVHPDDQIQPTFDMILVWVQSFHSIVSINQLATSEIAFDTTLLMFLSSAPRGPVYRHIGHIRSIQQQTF